LVPLPSTRHTVVATQSPSLMHDFNAQPDVVQRMPGMQSPSTLQSSTHAPNIMLQVKSLEGHPLPAPHAQMPPGAFARHSPLAQCALVTH
jgi:hypothetical protein